MTTPAAVVELFGHGTPIRVERLALGTMNDNWRVDTISGSLACKRILDIDEDQAIRSHRVQLALAERGIPIAVPLTTATGATVAHHAGSLYSASTWVDGDHRRLVDLDHDHARHLGRLLARTQQGLADLVDGPVHYPPVPQADRTAAGIDHLLTVIAEADDRFDAECRAVLRHRRELLDTYADQAPTARPDDLGPVGGTHGDFQLFNLLWSGDTVAAVLDWDRLRVAPLAVELVRAATLIFENDLALISTFVAAYQELMRLPADAVRAAVEHRWWDELCALWIFDRHYLKGLTSADHLMRLNEDRLLWWCDHRDAMLSAFAAVDGRLD